MPYISKKSFLLIGLFKPIFMLALLILATCSFAEEPRLNKRYNYNQALELAQNNERPMLLFFWNVYCSACTKLKSEVLSQADIHNLLEKRFLLAWIDTLNPAHKALLKHYQVRGTPNLIFTNIAYEGYPVGLARSYGATKGDILAALYSVLAQTAP